MIRTYHTFRLLQAVAAIAGLAILLWSLGLPSLRFAEAANVTSFSDTLSDSAPSTASDHTIEFVSPSGVATSESIVITFEDSSFNPSTIGAEDIDLLEDGVAEDIEGGGWTVLADATSITLTSDGSTSIAADATTTILIGLNAINEGTPNTQITNPTVGSYEITVDAGSEDSGATRVAIIDSVTVTASVDTTFNFTVRGVATGADVNGHTTTGSTTPTAIPFGVLEAGVASTAAQALDVTTNASNGFVVTVQVDQQLLSATGADIDGFVDGSYTTTPTAWASPTPVLGSENTYGHWGLTTEDTTVGESLSDIFGSQLYVSASTSPVEVFRHDGPADGTTADAGTTEVGFRVETSALQEAGDDYAATLTYVATPVF